MKEPLAGRYELHEVLGRGGMGVVYAGLDRLLERPVAVKVLPDDALEEPAAVRRFEHEALAAAALSHPNIVSVYDAGVDGTTRFIVMERVDGDNLSSIVSRRGPLPVREAVAIAAQVASALGAAHTAGIVHRDVKPANLMVDGAGTVKVLDFGIARAAGRGGLTRTAHVLGSAPYLAPEVAGGERADARSDIYALGCVLYELLSGRPPFTGELPVAILQQQASRPARPLRALRPDVPPALEALVARMLAKDPAERPGTGRSLAAALTASASPESVGQSGRSAASRVRPPRRSRLERSGLAIAAALIAAGLIAAVLSGGSAGRSRPAPARASAPVPLLSPSGVGTGLERGIAATLSDVTRAASALAAATRAPEAPSQPVGPHPGPAGPGSHQHGKDHPHGHGPGPAGPPGQDGQDGGG